MSNPSAHDEPPEKGTVHEPDLEHHASGHGQAAQAIIPEDSGADRLLTYPLPLAAVAVMIVFAFFMLTARLSESESTAPTATTVPAAR